MSLEPARTFAEVVPRRRTGLSPSRDRDLLGDTRQFASDASASGLVPLVHRCRDAASES
jgi:hypothetical protein